MMFELDPVIAAKLKIARNLAAADPDLSKRRVPENQAMAINRFLLEVARDLNLSDWMIVVNDLPPVAEDASATMNSRKGTKFAGVWVSDEFLNPDSEIMSVEIRTQTLIHEVIHMHFEEAWHFIDDIFDNEFLRVASDMGSTVFKRHMEVAVDQLAWSFMFLTDHRFVLPAPDSNEIQAEASSHSA